VIVKLLRDRQTDRQTDKSRVMNTVLGGGKEKQCQEMKDQITGRLENADSENA